MAAGALAFAAIFATLSLLYSKEQEVTANNLLVVAQFLTFSGTILGIDYKFNNNEDNK